MAIDNLLKGASINKRLAFTTTTTDELGNVVEVPIPHSGIVDVKVILKIRGEEVTKFSTNETDIAGDWEELTTEAEEGEFSYFVSGTGTAEWPVGVLEQEIVRIYHTEAENETLVSSSKLYNVVSSNFQATL